MECDDPTGTIVTLVNQSGATLQTTSGIANIPNYVESARLIPFQVGSILQNELSDPLYSIELISEDAVNHIATVRTISHRSPIDQNVTPQVWYFDTTTKLPVGVSLHEHSPKTPALYAWITLTLADFRRTGSLVVPYQWSDSVGSRIIETTRLSAVNQH